MSTAVDTPEQRLNDYARLFADALVRRERHDGAVVFAFHSDVQTRARVEDLARREAACCPFVGYRVETVGDEIIWTISNPVAGEDRGSVEVMLEAFHEFPDQAGATLAARGLRAPRSATATPPALLSR